MSKEAIKRALDRSEPSILSPGWTLVRDEDIASLREALAEQPAQQEPVAWPCLIAEADFSEDTVTLAMQCTDYKVSAGKHWLSTTPPAQRKPLTRQQCLYLEVHPRMTIEQVVRVVEAAHGIKENT